MKKKETFKIHAKWADKRGADPSGENRSEAVPSGEERSGADSELERSGAESDSELTIMRCLRLTVGRR